MVSARGAHAAISALSRHPHEPGLLRSACALTLAAWPYELGSASSSADAPQVAREAAAAFVAGTVEAVVGGIRVALQSRPDSEWFEDTSGAGSSLAPALEPAYAVLSELALRGDTIERVERMATLGAVALVVRTLLAASESGLWLPRGYELLLLLTDERSGARWRDAAIAAGAPPLWLQPGQPPIFDWGPAALES